MLPSKFLSERGSAILEFITFVLVGQLLILGLAVSTSMTLSHRAKLELFSATLARAISQGHPQLEAILRLDYQLPSALVRQISCKAEYVCLEVHDGQLSSVGVAKK